MERKRTRIDIIGDMLKSIRDKGGQIKPTHLMYKSNLAHKQMQGYLDELVGKEFVKKIKKNTYEYVIITDKGYEFITKLDEMKEFEKAFGL
jgi:predicted transcriptional regulator